MTQAEEEGDPEEPDNGVPRVLMTGASGFIATHVIYQLQQQGQVRFEEQCIASNARRR